MKKVLIIIGLVFLICLSVVLGGACKSTSENKYDELVNKSIVEIKSFWENKYNETDSSNRKNDIFIVNTRLITIDKNTYIEEFREVEYIIEFTIYSDYLGTNGKYYRNIGRCDSVAVHKDKTILVCDQNLIYNYEIRHYDFTYPMIIDVVDFGAQYNQRIILDINN
ncbi:MAG: hypothetical protein VZQ61_03790 [Christensenellaceae bacterium]